MRDGHGQSSLRELALSGRLDKDRCVPQTLRLLATALLSGGIPIERLSLFPLWQRRFGQEAISELFDSIFLREACTVKQVRFSLVDRPTCEHLVRTYLPATQSVESISFANFPPQVAFKHVLYAFCQNVHLVECNVERGTQRFKKSWHNLQKVCMRNKSLQRLVVGDATGSLIPLALCKLGPQNPPPYVDAAYYLLRQRVDILLTNKR